MSYKENVSLIMYIALKCNSTFWDSSIQILTCRIFHCNKIPLFFLTFYYSCYTIQRYWMYCKILMVFFFTAALQRFSCIFITTGDMVPSAEQLFSEFFAWHFRGNDRSAEAGFYFKTFGWSLVFHKGTLHSYGKVQDDEKRSTDD